MFRFIIGVIISVFMLSLLRMIMAAISGAMKETGSPAKAASQSGGSNGPRRTQGASPEVGGGELHKCPVCSTYHTVSNVAGKTAKGETLLFCSSACREKYVSV